MAVTVIVMENRATRTAYRAIGTVIGADLVPRTGTVIETETGRGTVSTGEEVGVVHGIAAVAVGPAAETGGVRGIVTAMIGETAEHRIGRIVPVRKVTTRRAPTITRV